MHFLLPTFILRLYTGCRLDQTLSKCIASFIKVKVLKCFFFVEYTWRVAVFLCRSDNFDNRYCFYKISENFELEFKDFKE